MPRTRMKKPAAPSAAPGPAQIRTATSATLEASISRIGWKTSRNCGTAKSNSPWKVESPIRKAPPSSTCITRRLRVARSGRTARETAAPSIRRIMPPSVESEAPPNSSRCVGPHSVTSWPKMRCQRSSSGKPASATPEQKRISTPPSGASRPPGSLQGRRARRLGREEDRQQAGEEHAEQPDEDEVVRRVGERAGVAPRVEVRRDVPVHPEHGRDQGAREHAERQRRPRRQAGHALGVEAQAVQDLDAPGAVAEHEIEHDRGHDHRPDRPADDLAQLAAAGGWGAGSALREGLIWPPCV